MEELIAKSKMYKAIKAQQKEEDFTETERLDAALADLMAGGLRGLMRPKGVKRWVCWRWRGWYIYIRDGI